MSFRPHATWTLILLNVAVFLMNPTTGDIDDGDKLYAMGALRRELIWNGEYWRFLTPMFLHIGLPHLILNNLSLYNLGPMIEQWAGTNRFLLIYFLAGFTGSVACLLGHDVGSAGASGGVFGLMGGALAVLYVQYYRDWGDVVRSPMGRQVAFWTLINFGFGLSSARICNWAHFGGWLGGMAACAWFAPDFLRRRREHRRALWGAGFLLALAVCTAYAVYPFRNGRYYSTRAQRAWQAGAYQQAYSDYERAISLGDTWPGATYNIALAALQLERNTEAARYLEAFVELEPDHAGAWALLAETRDRIGDPAGARQARERLVRLKATDRGEGH